jgi:myo-inositol-1(or 4)-monophosphatase
VAPDPFKEIALAAALKSGEFIKKSVGKIRRLSYKGKTNIVTDVDKSAERMIIRKIRRSFPGHAILSEESSPAGRPSPYKWIIDPLDGTTNFAHAFPFFCVSIALEKDGRIILGVVYDPLRKELFTAQEGRGSRLNGRPIRVSKVSALSKSFLATGFAYDLEKRSNTNIKNFRNFLKNSLAIRRAGSAALDLSYVACGRFDGFWEIGLHPWDSAAGILIVREAGGVVTGFDRSRFSHYDDKILASNGLIHRQMIKILS